MADWTAGEQMQGKEVYTIKPIVVATGTSKKSTIPSGASGYCVSDVWEPWHILAVKFRIFGLCIVNRDDIWICGMVRK